MKETATIQRLGIKERIEYYEDELRQLTPPTTFREQVLTNVYRYLLKSCRKQQTKSSVNLSV